MYFRKLTWSEFTHSLKRRKLVVPDEGTKLNRCLSTLDLTALGIGSTLGVGVYVLAGEVSKSFAGPAVVISFAIAAIASVFAGLCYAEFGARVPKAGSAYVYSYVSIGEFVAFVIGWNLILEYVIGSASVVKGLFTYLDALCDQAMSTWFHDTMPMDIPSMGSYPDFFSLGITLLFSIALAFGAKESTLVNNVFTVVNLGVVLFVIISGFWNVDPKNWAISKEEIANNTNGTGKDYGEGGFAPYGIAGIIEGAARCFYGFIGFDCIATAGEEAKTPQKSIPIAVVTSLLIIFLAYFGISTVLTMMLPYYLQDPNAPLPYVYEVIGWEWAKYLVTAGALCGLLSSLLGAMFPLPRIIYALSSDGLMFEFMGRVHPKFKTPMFGTLLAGLFTGIMSALFELTQLFLMMSIGTLLAYSMVAACVLILRYDDTMESDYEKYAEKKKVTIGAMLKQVVNWKQQRPNRISALVVSLEIIIYCLFCFGFSAILTQCDLSENLLPLIGVVIFVLGAIALLISINFQPKSSVKLSFMVPFVPWLPALSIAINLYLMTTLDKDTWMRFGIWIAIGLFIYFAYGLWNSKEGLEDGNRKERRPKISKISVMSALSEKEQHLA